MKPNLIWSLTIEAHCQAVHMGHAGVMELVPESKESVEINTHSNSHGEMALYQAAISCKEAGARVLDLRAA